MKKLFLIMMMCLLPHQFAWAMVASYDTHDNHDAQDASVHFGHHLHQVEFAGNTQHADQNDSDTSGTQKHVDYGFCHLTCGELLQQALPVLEPINNHFSSQYLLSYYALIPKALDKPQWAAAV